MSVGLQIFCNLYKIKEYEILRNVSPCKCHLPKYWDQIILDVIDPDFFFFFFSFRHIGSDMS